jgi:hypothetical protein
MLQTATRVYASMIASYEACIFEECLGGLQIGWVDVEAW